MIVEAPEVAREKELNVCRKTGRFGPIFAVSGTEVERKIAELHRR